MFSKLDASGLQLVQPPDESLCKHNLPCGMCPHAAEPGCPDFNSTDSEEWYLHNTFTYGPRVPYGLYAADADLDDYFRFTRRHPEYDSDDIPF